MSSILFLFTFVRAEFIQNQLTRIQASKSDLEKSMVWYVPSYSRPWTGRAVGSSRAGLWPIAFGSGWPAGRRAFAKLETSS